MTQDMIIQLLMVGGVLVIASVLLRVMSGGKYEIKTTDSRSLSDRKMGKGWKMVGVKTELSALWAKAAGTKRFAGFPILHPGGSKKSLPPRCPRMAANLPQGKIAHSAKQIDGPPIDLGMIE